MNEKLFKRVILVAVKNYKSRVYEFTLRTGVITVVAGAACGILMIVTGAKLLAAKPDTLF